MSARIVATLMALLVLVSPAAAQETRGSIEGIIKDSSGAILPGVTVEARGLTVGSTATAVTDGAGIYRFPALCRPDATPSRRRCRDSPPPRASWSS